MALFKGSVFLEASWSLNTSAVGVADEAQVWQEKVTRPPTQTNASENVPCGFGGGLGGSQVSGCRSVTKSRLVVIP